MRPEADDYRFSERSDERRQLFQQLKSLKSPDRLPTVLWAFLQVSDIEVLRRGFGSEMFLEMFGNSEDVERKAVDALLLGMQK